MEGTCNSSCLPNGGGDTPLLGFTNVRLQWVKFEGRKPENGYEFRPKNLQRTLTGNGRLGWDMILRDKGSRLVFLF